MDDIKDMLPRVLLRGRELEMGIVAARPESKEARAGNASPKLKPSAKSKGTMAKATTSAMEDGSTQENCWDSLEDEAPAAKKAKVTQPSPPPHPSCAHSLLPFLLGVSSLSRVASCTSRSWRARSRFINTL